MGTDLGTWGRLPGPIRADVVVVGAGITGATTALLLKRAGKNVLLVDAAYPGAGETSRTTAHVTAMPDLGLATLLEHIGPDEGRVALHAYAAAIDFIETFVGAHQVDCDFARVPGFIFCEPGDGENGRRALHREADAARELGLPIAAVDEAPLPFPVAGALRLERQAQFHPLAYLRGLLAAVDGDGSRVLERTRVTAVHDGEPCRVETDGGEIVCDQVVVAAHVPVTNRVLLHTKLTPQRSYVLAAVAERPSEPGLFWDVATPYHYWRTARIGDEILWIVGGEDHRVGEGHVESEAIERLERYVVERLGRAPVRYRWSGQIIEPADGLPYVGRNSLSRHVFVATGFSGNGMAGGTMAAMILADLVQGSEHPWGDVFSATRVRPRAAGSAIVRQNASAAKHLVVDRLRAPSARVLPLIQPGEGQVVETENGPLAVYRYPTGQLSALSAVCTHLGCLVAWNGAEKTWDCPCHGSRYATSGEVLNGPAVEPLARRELAGQENTQEAAVEGPAYGEAAPDG